MVEIDDERKLRIFYDKRMSQEVKADVLGDEFKGYVLKIMGGNDKQGFPMKQGVLLPHRVRLLLSKGHSCYRPRRTGERKRKSVRGCIVAQVRFFTIIKWKNNRYASNNTEIKMIRYTFFILISYLMYIICLQDIAALSLVVTQKGETDIPGLTDVSVPKRLGPKRANKIRKLFNLTKEDDITKYVIRREVPSKKHEGKTNSKVFIYLPIFLLNFIGS